VDTKPNLNDLIGKDLKDFKIVQMTEVYRVDDDERKSSPLGFFKDPNIAKVFAGAQTDANWHKTAPAFVLTDGTVGYVIGQSEPVKLFNDEEEAVNLRKKAVAKLSPEERKLLGFED